MVNYKLNWCTTFDVSCYWLLHSSDMVYSDSSINNASKSWLEFSQWDWLTGEYGKGKEWFFDHLFWIKLYICEAMFLLLGRSKDICGIKSAHLDPGSTQLGTQAQPPISKRVLLDLFYIPSINKWLRGFFSLKSF